MGITITDVRVVPGDSAFLVDDGQTSILCDTGFGFTGARIAENIRKQLGGRKLDYILLTHSHYDHVLAMPHILRAYPEAKVIAGEYAARIFAKPSARATMRALDLSAAQKQNMANDEDLTEALKVDIAVKDGDEIVCGDMVFSVIALPGHTKCSVGFYMKENGLLLGAETLGVYFGQEAYLPSYLVGYQLSMDSFERAKALDVRQLLIPHYGVVGQREARAFLVGSQRAAQDTAMRIKAILSSGGSKEEAFAWFKETYYIERIRPAYPIDAFNLNTHILIDLVARELLGK